MQAILVVQLARFGDLIQSKRLLLSLAKQPNTHIHLCVDVSLVQLAKRIYPFAHVIAILAHNSAQHTPAQVLNHTQQVFTQLQQNNYSAVYTLNNSPLSYAIAHLFPYTIVHGYSSKHGQNIRTTLCRLAARWSGHRVSAPLNLVDFWAYFTNAPIPPEQVNPVPKQTQHNRIGVALAGREQRRSLPPKVLAKCIHAIFIARGGPEIVCIGTKQEQRTVKELAALLPASIYKKVVNTTGKTALTDLPDLVASVDCLLTPDTGLMHLAAHLGVPVQAFFLSSAWCFETGPYGFGHKVWQASTPCAPCLESAPCNHNMQCLEDFAHKDFLTHISGKYTPSWPTHLTGYISMLDPLGVTYTPVDGPDSFATQRKHLRNILTQHLQHTLQQPAHHAAHELFNERDWMLPDSRLAL